MALRYPLADVTWIDERFKDHLAQVCQFPPTLPHISWSAMKEYFLEVLDPQTFYYYFTRADSDLAPLAYCIMENW